MRTRIAWVGVLLLVQTVQTWRYVRVWQTEERLWQHAVHVAPRKPWPRIAYARALFNAGRMEDGAAQIDRARALNDQAHLWPWDRQDAAVRIYQLGGVEPFHNGPLFRMMTE